MESSQHGSPPPIISFVGKSDSGKTTFLEKLLPVLKRRGYKAGVVKHDVHGFDIDHPGKDSHRLKSAGAYATIISSPFKIAMVKDTAEDTQLVKIAAGYLADCDMVLTEGYKRESVCRIEVSYSANTKEILCGEGECLAFVADWKPETSAPVFGLDDAEGVADFIEKTFFPDRAGGGGKS